MEGGEIKIITKEGQVAMDFSGERGKVITDMKEIQELTNTRNKVVRINIDPRQQHGFCSVTWRSVAI